MDSALQLYISRMAVVEPEHYMEFITAGRAKFDLINLETGNQQRYVVKQAKDNKNRWWVNNQSFTMLGWIDKSPIDNHYGWTKSKYITNEADSTSWDVMDWFLTFATQNMVPSQVKMYYDARCGHCGRKITDPLSISRGIGPECWKKLVVT